MNPWFEDLPLDFTRDDTREVEQLLIAAFPMNIAVLTLAQNAGLNLAALISTWRRSTTWSAR